MAEADRRRAQRPDSERFRFEQGVAEALPYDDEAFDLVTCQTVLMHVADPEAVIAEMVRVTKRGGLVLASEPNNAVSALLGSSVTVDMPVEAKLEATRFQLLWERGQLSLGRGNSSFGDVLPGYLARAGLSGVQAYVNDKASMMIAPYEGAEQRAHIEQRAEFIDQGLWWGISRAQALEYFVAGGGSQDEFASIWPRLLERQRAELESIQAGELHTAGGQIQYIAGGWRVAGPS